MTNEKPMIGQLGDPSMTPDQTAQKHVDMNKKFGMPNTVRGKAVPVNTSPTIHTNADDPSVPELLWNAYRTARIMESGGTWVGKDWDKLSEHKRKRFAFTAEVFAESVGWDQ
jgi:hypothetical protein